MAAFSSSQQAQRRSRRRRIAARQCPDCHTLYSLHVVDHPSGLIVVCADCGRVERVAPGTAAAGLG